MRDGQYARCAFALLLACEAMAAATPYSSISDAYQPLTINQRQMLAGHGMWRANHEVNVTHEVAICRCTCGSARHRVGHLDGGSGGVLQDTYCGCPDPMVQSGELCASCVPAQLLEAHSSPWRLAKGRDAGRLHSACDVPLHLAAGERLKCAVLSAVTTAGQRCKCSASLLMCRWQQVLWLANQATGLVVDHSISWAECEAWLTTLASRALLCFEDGEEALQDMTQPHHAILAQVRSSSCYDCDVVVIWSSQSRRA